MNSFKHELKSNFTNFTIWNIGILGSLLMMLVFYPSIAADSEAFVELLNAYPPAMQEAIGFSPDMVNSIVGYYNVSTLYPFIVGGIMAMIYGMNIFAKENKMKTLDFLLTKPVTRFEVITAKLSAVLVYILATNIIFILASQIMCELFSEEAFNNQELALLSCGLIVIQFFFVGFGMIIASVFRVAKSVVSIALGSVFGMAILSMFAGVVDKDYFRYLTPFKAIDANFVISNSSIEPQFIIYYLLISVIFAVGSYLVFIKKDIQAG